MIERWRGTKRWLCIRLDQIGDVLMTTPAIRALRDSAEDVHITLLTPLPEQPLRHSSPRSTILSYMTLHG
jgi:ADP-heptose:LPS heptosyltransferase